MSDQDERDPAPDQSQTEERPPEIPPELADPAAARHRAVPELVHAARGGPRQPPSASSTTRSTAEADRGLHAARRRRRGAPAGRPLPGRHRDPHPQDVQAAGRQPAADRAGPGARAPQRGARLTQPVPARRRARGAEAARGRGPPRDRRPAAEHQVELPAVVSLSPLLSDDLQTLALNITEPGTSGRLHRLEPQTMTVAKQECSRRSTCGSAWRLNRILIKELEVLELGSKSSPKCSRRSARTSASTSCASR